MGGAQVLAVQPSSLPARVRLPDLPEQHEAGHHHERAGHCGCSGFRHVCALPRVQVDTGTTNGG